MFAFFFLSTILGEKQKKKFIRRRSLTCPKWWIFGAVTAFQGAPNSFDFFKFYFVVWPLFDLFKWVWYGIILAFVWGSIELLIEKLRNRRDFAFVEPDFLRFSLSVVLFLTSSSVSNGEGSQTPLNRGHTPANMRKRKREKVGRPRRRREGERKKHYGA